MGEYHLSQAQARACACDVLERSKDAELHREIYQNQLGLYGTIEWPEVISESEDIEACRTMLKDALQEMILAYRQQDRELPSAGGLLEQMPVEVELVG